MVVAEHATDGTKALRLDRGYAMLDAAQNWSGYDFLKADVYTDAKAPLELYVEVQRPADARLLDPGQLHDGRPARSEHADHPDRPLRRREVAARPGAGAGRRSPGWSSPSATSPQAPLFLDNLRLERDTEPAQVQFDGLWAFDVGPAGSPVMEGFTPLDFEQDLHQRPRLRLEERPALARLRRLAARPALPGLPLHREGRPGPRRAQRHVSRLRQHGFALRLLGRGPALPQAGADPRRRPPRGHDGPGRRSRPATSATGTATTCPPTTPSTSIRSRTSTRNTTRSRSATASSTSTSRARTGPAASRPSSSIPTRRPPRASGSSTSSRSAGGSTSTTPSSACCPTPTGAPVAADGAEQSRGFVAFTPRLDEGRPRPGPAARPARRWRHLTGSAFAGEYEPVTVSVLPLRDLGRVTVDGHAT